MLPELGEEGEPTWVPLRNTRKSENRVLREEPAQAADVRPDAAAEVPTATDAKYTISSAMTTHPAPSRTMDPAKARRNTHFRHASKKGKTDQFLKGTPMMMEGKAPRTVRSRRRRQRRTGPESMRTVQTLGEDTRHAQRATAPYQPKSWRERDEHSSSSALSIAQDDKDQ